MIQCGHEIGIGGIILWRNETRDIDLRQMPRH
jgi:hypothetical protein